MLSLRPKRFRKSAGAIAEAPSIYRAAAEKQALERVEGGTSRKAFMMQAAEGAAMNRYTDIMRAAVARPLLDAVTEYLGEVPILGNVTIMVSVPNNSQVGSQLYHLDFADEKQVKLFIYVDEVTQDNGPFTFTPISVTNELIKAYGYDRGRLTHRPGREGGRPGQGDPGYGTGRNGAFVRYVALPALRIEPQQDDAHRAAHPVCRACGAGTAAGGLAGR